MNPHGRKLVIPEVWQARAKALGLTWWKLPVKAADKGVIRCDTCGELWAPYGYTIKRGCGCSVCCQKGSWWVPNGRASGARDPLAKPVKPGPKPKKGTA